MHWTLISRIVPSAVGLPPDKNCQSPLGEPAFTSTTAGWMTVGCQTAKPELLATHDGGHSWRVQVLPTSNISCPCGDGQPVVIDQAHALVELYADQGGSQTVYTSDGGSTWKVLPPIPTAGFALATDYVDADNFWAIVPPPGWMKGQPARDSLYRTRDGGQTWTLVQADLPIGYPVNVLVFGDATHGLLTQPQNASAGPPIGPGTEMLTTSDGGHTWTAIKPQMETPG
jgi:photosystem II stability/assembly factor-like uncharacterized protein